MRKLLFIFTMTSALLAAAAPAVVEPVRDFTTVAKKAIPAVVYIKVKGSAKNESLNNENLDEFWSQFFNLPQMSPRQELVQGQASGFIISPDGYILTNSHVIDGMKEIKVILNDKREFTGKVVGSDPNTDVALVKIEATDLPYIALGNSDDLEVGQWVVAIGNPYGLQATLTVGVVSAKGRNDLDLTRIEDFIQTDAAINRGNSGGPLLNLDGQVVGINTAIVSNMANGGYMGIGFAIPSNIVKNDMEQILDKGKVSRGFLGVTLQPMDEDLASAFGTMRAEGILISDVTKDSPAAKAGLKQGDVILKFNGATVSNVAALRNTISLMKPGTQVQLTILNQDKTTREVTVTVGDFPTETTLASAKSENLLGIEVQTASGDVKGVVVSTVKPGSLAAWAGIKKGALITSVNQKPVSTVEEYNQAVASTEKGKPVLLLIKQGEFTRYVSLKQEIK